MGEVKVYKRRREGGKGRKRGNRVVELFTKKEGVERGREGWR